MTEDQKCHTILKGLSDKILTSVIIIWSDIDDPRAVNWTSSHCSVGDTLYDLELAKQALLEVDPGTRTVSLVRSKR